MVRFGPQLLEAARGKRIRQENEFELPPALVRGKHTIEVTFRPEGVWTIGELRAFSHWALYVER